MCSSEPRLKMNLPIVPKISDHEFFRARNIRIPLRLGRKGIRLNKYEHLNVEPTWRTMLECDCQILGRDVAENDICAYGRIINVSRGVGGDRSFFVHATNSSGSYKVVAHICFEGLQYLTK